jgi:transcriptional regulator
MKNPQTDLLQGTLEMLILKALSLGPMHGWSVSKRIEQVSANTLQIKQGSLYPALHRLESKGYVVAEWNITEDHRRAKFYQLTPKGQVQLDAETHGWARFACAVNAVLAMG